MLDVFGRCDKMIHMYSSRDGCSIKKSYHGKKQNETIHSITGLKYNSKEVLHYHTRKVVSGISLTFLYEIFKITKVS